MTLELLKYSRRYSEARSQSSEFQDMEKLVPSNGRVWLVKDRGGRGVEPRLCECRDGLRGGCFGENEHSIRTTVVVILDTEGFDALLRMQYSFHYKPRITGGTVDTPSSTGLGRGGSKRKRAEADQSNVDSQEIGSGRRCTRSDRLSSATIASASSTAIRGTGVARKGPKKDRGAEASYGRWLRRASLRRAEYTSPQFTESSRPIWTIRREPGHDQLVLQGTHPSSMPIRT